MLHFAVPTHRRLSALFLRESRHGVVAVAMEGGGRHGGGRCCSECSGRAGGL